MVRTVDSDSASFTRFVEEVAPRLRQALVARYGPEIGDEATSEALEYAWQNWDRVTVMSNAAGYLYRVGQSRAKGLMAPRRLPFASLPPRKVEHWFEPKLGKALSRLSAKQRAAVVLVHGLAWTITEVAEMWGVSFSTVQSHLERAMAKLRKHLGAKEYE